MAEWTGRHNNGEGQALGLSSHETAREVLLELASSFIEASRQLAAAAEQLAVGSIRLIKDMEPDINAPGVLEAASADDPESQISSAGTLAPDLGALRQATDNSLERVRDEASRAIEELSAQAERARSQLEQVAVAAEQRLRALVEQRGTTKSPETPPGDAKEVRGASEYREAETAQSVERLSSGEPTSQLLPETAAQTAIAQIQRESQLLSGFVQTLRSQIAGMTSG